MVVLFVVILVVVGPKRLPEVARKLGRIMETFRRAADEFKDQLLSMDQDSSASSPSSPAAGGDTPTDNAEAYEPYNPYPDTADYPGNEGQAENWATAKAAPEAEGAAAAPADSAPAPVEPSSPPESAPAPTEPAP